MDSYFYSKVKEVTGAEDVHKQEVIQELWSGYGEIVRYRLDHAEVPSIVVKHVRLPERVDHPRGWNGSNSHERKVESYRIEMEWYKSWADRCGKNSPIPKCYALDRDSSGLFMILEDLDSSGYPVRKSQVAWSEFEACIEWLANFHATYLGQEPKGLWPIGTYWHLSTRPDELKVLTDRDLKHYASAIDNLLNSSPFQTIVHGDAKLANFCFSESGSDVAAVDFQYVGGGCGVKDLAYFVGSCLYEDDCEEYESKILDIYFKELGRALKCSGSVVPFDELEANWRSLYPVAWTDFHRFLKGWSPGHWKINSYSERVSKQVIKELKRNGTT